MKQVKLTLLFLLTAFVAFGQTVTPDPGPYTPMNQKYQYRWLKTTGGIWNTGKLVQVDSAQFSGVTYVPSAASNDSSIKAANTAWVRRLFATGTGGGGGSTGQWDTAGNAGLTDPRLGTTDNTPFALVTNNIKRLIMPAAGILSASSNYVYLVKDTLNGELKYTTLGGGGSTDTTSLSNRINLKLNITDTAGFTKNTATQTLTNKTLTSPVINVGSDATGDMYYRNSGGAFTRLPIGTAAQRLAVVGGVPVWRDTAAAGGGGITGSGVFGRIPFFNGSSSVTSDTAFRFSPYTIASSGSALGLSLSPRLISTANTDILVALDITPTFPDSLATSTKKRLIRAGGETGLMYSIVTATNDNFLELKNTSSSILLGGVSKSGAGNQISITGSSSGGGNGVSFIAQNTNSGGSTNFSLKNSGGKYFSTQVTGSAYPGGEGAQFFTAGGSLRMDFITDADFASGQTSPITFSAGGYANESMRILGSKNILIGTTTDAASAILNVNSTTKGFLPPRQTTTERNAIATPATGLSVYNTTLSTNDVKTAAAWYQQPNGLTGSGTLDFPSTGSHSSEDLTITVTGAADGDMVILGVPNASVTNDSNYSAWVSAANTVTVRYNHYGSGTSNPASGNFKVYVIKN
jgi:hypothetical protein